MIFLTLAAFAGGGLLSVVLTRMVLAWLRHKQILDRPNDRSSHTIPTPRGGGLGVTSAVLAIWAVLIPLSGVLTTSMVAGLAGALALMAASWVDDRRGLPPAPRFLVQALVVGAALATLPLESLVFHGFLPFWADRVIAFVGWLWFVNLYNFMDGIDGITGVETAILGIGIGLVAALSGQTDLIPPNAALAGVGLGFLVWNWHPARLFLGDAGSIPLGFLLGLMLVHLAAAGQVVPALILPAYYLADATITLTRRALKREKIWQAHRQHFYQRAVQGGKRHDQVSMVILAGGVLLMAAAIAAISWPIWGAVGAVLITGGMLAVLQNWSRGSP